MTSKIKIAAVAAACSLFFLIGRDSVRVDHKDQKHEVDSLGHDLSLLKVEHIRYIDSVTTEELSRDSAIRVLQASLNRSKGDLMASGIKANRTVEKYRHDREDTSMALTDCDSLVVQFLAYKDVSEETIKQADSLINLQYKQIASKNETIVKLNIDFNKAVNDGLLIKDKYDSLYKDYRKKTNWWNRWGSKAAAFIVGGFLVHTLTK